MFRMIACLTEQHALVIVALAPLVCWISNVITFRLLRQTSASQGIRRFGWLLAASFAIGAGVWCTHFIAMLGYDPGVVVGFEPAVTLLSLAVAIVSATIGLALYQGAPGRVGVACGGIVVGLGVAAMHYVGMAGVQIPGRFVWNADLVAVSVLAVTILASLSLHAFARNAAKGSTIAAASILTAGIAAVHVVGMGAAQAVPDPSAWAPDEGLPRAALALGIAGAMLVTLACAGMGLLAERLRLSNEELRAKSAQLSAALGNMSQGLVMFDATTVQVSRYRWRASNIPTPWASTPGPLVPVWSAATRGAPDAVKSRTSGAEGGPGKRTESNLDTAPRSDPTSSGWRSQRSEPWSSAAADTRCCSTCPAWRLSARLPTSRTDQHWLATAPRPSATRSPPRSRRCPNSYDGH